MPISLESNSATMLINQCAHGLAGRPGSSRSISRSARNRASTTTNERTNERTTNRSVATDSGEREGTRYLHHSRTLIISVSGRTPYKHLALRFLAIVRESRDCRKVKRHGFFEASIFYFHFSFAYISASEYFNLTKARAFALHRGV